MRVSPTHTTERQRARGGKGAPPTTDSDCDRVCLLACLMRMVALKMESVCLGFKTAGMGAVVRWGVATDC